MHDTTHSPGHAAPDADPDPAPATAPDTARRTQWISTGIETWLATLAPDRFVQQGGGAVDADADASVDADVLIIGSGYGGAVAAARLAGQHVKATGAPLKVVVLERGREYLAGAFPSRAADLAGHLRFTTPHGQRAQGRLDGLFDLRLGEDINVVLANGVGGGSLINAGVLELPLPALFSDPSAWPAGLPDAAAMAARAGLLRQRLGAHDPQPGDAAAGLPRTAYMARLQARRVPISVALTDGHTTSGGALLSRCIGCGDCATGCNHNAKDSLDLNLLRSAQQRGASIYAGATVSRLRRAGHAWEAEVWHTDATLRQRMARGQWVRARHIVLAAGSLGSTEILLRSQTDGLRFSPRLGQGFSANGDMLAMLYGAPEDLGGVADEDKAAGQRKVGPTITSMLDQRADAGLAVQDLGVPGPLARLFEELATTTALLQQIDQKDTTVHAGLNDAPDPMAVSPALIRGSMALAMMYRDRAQGRLSTVPDDPHLPGDAGLRIDWAAARLDPALAKAHTTLAAWLAKHAPAPVRLLPNPMWQLLPPAVVSLLGSKPGPLITVHPLGGCGMAGSAAAGVVNPLGQVFDPDAAPGSAAVHPGLAVLDGAVLPCALGINPALTIATLADLALDGLIAAWGLVDAPAAVTETPAALPVQRPVFRPMPDPEHAPPAPAKTEVQVIERLAGWVDLRPAPGHPEVAGWVELDLVYAQRPLFPADGGSQRPGFTQQGHVLPVALDEHLSRLRIFAQPGSRFDSSRPDTEAWFVAPLAAGSHLRFLHREPSQPRARIWRALAAWLPNRGGRDSLQALIEWMVGMLGASRGKLNLCERIRQACALASRGGEVRLFDYALVLGRPSRAVGPLVHLAPSDDQPDDPGGLPVTGSKRLSYTRRGNPWAQLMQMDLQGLAGMALPGRRQLAVQPAYFAGKRMPLLRVMAQADQPSALIDQLAFLAYLARVLLNLHVWSLRKPDQACWPSVPQRLPGALRGLPAPQCHQFRPDGAADDAEIRLTAYRQPDGGRGPVLMIHGYSASGTTFAHPALQPSLAAHLWRQGFEPWVLDLRTSCGMPSADRPYSFEEIALADIPAALRKVCQVSGRERVDVITHCMGSAMLSMALQADAPCGPQVAARLRRWVMSQFGPRLRFSPANQLRAYLVSYFREALPDYRYSLRPGDDVPGVDGGLYDRLVNTLPYLEDAQGSEFDVENPWWQIWRRTPWVGTRHRLDALIGRTFDARQMSRSVLARIDDFFGPTNLRTLSQPIFFAQMGEVAGAQGLDAFGSNAAPLLQQVAMLSLHGGSNGLADPETAELLRDWADESGLDLRQRCFCRHGHQDLLIGRDSAEVFDTISDFLLPATLPPGASDARPCCQCQPQPQPQSQPQT